MPFSQENRHFTLSLIAIIVGLFVVAIGVQAFLVQQARDDAAQARNDFDKEQLKQDAKDQAYSECLTNFAADLVDTLQAGRDATARLNNARDRKDKALDQLIVISAKAQATGAQTQDQLPPGLVRRYERVLAERVAAQKAYNQASRNYVQTRQANPLVSPKVVCNR